MAKQDQNQGKSKAHARKSPHRRAAYFRDNQITFLVMPVSASDIFQISDDAIKEFSEKISENLNRWVDKGVKIELTQAFSFPALTIPELPKEELQLTSNGLDVKALARPFSILNYSITDESNDPADLLDTILKLRTAVKAESSNDKPTVASLEIQSISPNWLMSASSQGGGTGGPGGKPSPYKGDRSQAPYYFTLKSELENAKFDGNGANIDVAVLDTAPCPHELVLAPKEWADHPLIPGLLGTHGVQGKLRLYPATYEELIRMGNTSLNRHDYPMTDHGLFAAGIIHSFVPDATIHLIEVLNPFGVGDLTSLANGLVKALSLYKPGSGRYLVVNCSWMLELPYDETHLYGHRTDLLPDKQPVKPTSEEIEFEKAVLAFVQADEEQAFLIKTVCEKLALVGSQVIAAAGNDWEAEKNQRNITIRPKAPPARYPAAFEQVIGVGALPINSRDLDSLKHNASSYSNLGDKPERYAVATLGGEEGPGKGVLGLYLGSFPPISESDHSEPNDSKWAWWAGTSFAAPILTGAIAVLLSSTNGPRTTQEALNKLKTSGLIVRDDDKGTGAKEDVMETTQGLPRAS